MASHLTLRMAWHDNKWNGTICQDPEKNSCCVGSRSLLSDRIARNRNLEMEVANAGKKIDSLVPSYLPPCYWSSAAFSPREQKIIHAHPFRKYEETKKIEETLDGYSMFSWPFRLSFTHSQKKKRAQGDYPRDLEDKRIPNFISKFDPSESIVFFYLNYDNPISGEEEKYALVGCAVLNKKIQIPPDFDFSKDELKKERSIRGRQNFPTMNWATQVSYDFEKQGIRLPYHEYREYIKEYPDESEKLEEIRVLIEEPSLIFGFKYVMADIDEDQCILLLTKLRKSIDIIQQHGIVNFSREQKLVNQLLKKAWKRRGLYPGLSNVLDLVLEDEPGTGERIVERIRGNLAPDEDLCEKTFSLLLNQKQKVPKYLQEFDTEIYHLRRNISQHTAILDLLKKLSLFLLKIRQIENIVQEDEDSFGREISAEDIVRNPYLVCEEYKCELTLEDRDDEEIEDDPIDLFKIDIGMFPEKHLKENRRLQDLAPASPERLRAVIIELLYSVGHQGHCYSVLDEVYDNILEYPLFYKRRLLLNKEQLSSQSYVNHFKEKITLVPNKDAKYFYLNEVLYAEEIIRNSVTTLLDREDHPTEIQDVKSFVRDQANKLKKQGIINFDPKQFIEERKKLLRNVLKRSFYVISGKPGTGKTKVLEKIIKELTDRHERVTVLTPTGKAALRLKVECGAKEAQTIDRFIYADRNRYWEILEDFSLILEDRRERPRIENLIIDESSMVDLQKLTTLFLMLHLKGEERVKRVIMVGDENQLPPIGFGRPFYDIIQYIKKNPRYKEVNFIKLLTNCRQESDPKVLEFADVFTRKNRYYNELLDELVKGEGEISKGLAVEKWSTIEDLHRKTEKRLDELFQTEIEGSDLSKCNNKSEKLNLIFKLYSTGYVNERALHEGKKLGIDNFQILTPYRTEAYGSMTLSRFIQQNYPRELSNDPWFGGVFNHSDKIIRLSNEYRYDYRLKSVVLRLCNGSLGIINNKVDKRTGWSYRKYFFTDQEKPISSLERNPLKDEDFELAYAITVHKSQGSDFGNVFFVVPSKRALLTKELLYTALTRSKRSVTVFIQKEKGREILECARTRSAVLRRNTSIFEPPENAKKIFEPAKGKKGVKSKIEYIIYKTLEESGLDFEYEAHLHLEKGPFAKIKPDFTIYVDDKTYYWEHLGELDLKEYWTKWVARRDWYRSNGKYDVLITTDDLGGVKNEIILRIFEDIKKGKLKTTEDSQISGHHYKLYV